MYERNIYRNRDIYQSISIPQDLFFKRSYLYVLINPTKVFTQIEKIYTYFEYKTGIYIFEMKECRHVFNSHLENYSYANYTLVTETWGHFEYNVMPRVCVCV